MKKKVQTKAVAKSKPVQKKAVKQVAKKPMAIMADKKKGNRPASKFNAKAYEATRKKVFNLPKD